jgi:hypothetical protein
VATTAEARAWLAVQLAERIRAGRLVVSDGSTSASTTAEVAVEGATVIVTGVFDEREANFHWRRRELFAGDGTLVDGLDEDLGEKLLGAIWTLEVPLEVVE